MRYAYVHEFGRTCMLGKVSRVKGGYAGFWQQVAASYVPNLKCNMEVINIDRTGGVIKVLARNNNTDVKEKLEFDYIFLTGALPFCTSTDGTYRSPSPPQRNNHHKLLNFTPTEEVLFSRVRTIEYYTTILRISQLNLEAGFYFCKNYVEDPQKIGHPVAIQRFFPDRYIFGLVVWEL
ncbi:hypothetical protein O6H91_Y227600 [Diphasiastrum complanatum]|nr:hypothetical protein O6H91_Y227600 [Diphasiastrum complanatum]